MKHDVAVVVPCYNQGRTVAETVESILGQTRRPAEIILVNDGSTDLYTRQVLRTADWPGVTIVETPNRGLPATRNHGIRLTMSEYLVTLDADDVLEPRYLERTAALLDADPSIGFVTTAIRGFGEASYVWESPPCDLVTAFARGTAHPASLFRRRLWDDVGGFDEVNLLHGIEDMDFWISAMERGFKGHVLADVLVRYRVTARSMHQRNVASGAHLRAIEALHTKHRSTLERLGVELLAAKEDSFLNLWSIHQRLNFREQELRGKANDLDERIRQAAETLRLAGREPVEWGDLRRLTPISPMWGMDRSGPLDRYYIKRFLDRNRADIKGSVLEVKESWYTRDFGTGVTRSEVVDIDPSNSTATIVADLARADGIPSDTFDCFILTQTLPFIFDTRAVLSHACRILRPGGVVLCTVPASGRISYEDDGIDGDFWRFTEASVRRLFAEVFPLENFEVEVSGNVLVSAAFLYGLSPAELRQEELDHVDPFFPLIITIRAVKPGRAPGRVVARRAAAAKVPSTSAAGAILLYHRVGSSTERDNPAVDRDHFRGHMEYLRRECDPMTLQELATAASAGSIPERAVAVTVDDGGLDSLEIVSPIVRELGIPITFFLNTEQLDQEHERWWDILRRILLGTEPVPKSMSVFVQGTLQRFDTATAAGRRAAYDALHGSLLTAALDERTERIRALTEWSGLDLAPRRTHRALTSGEIRQLAAAGHDIGAHTVHHLMLGSQSRDVQTYEIAESKRTLESLLQRPVDTFAYPYGQHSDECDELVRAAGFAAAVVVDGHLVTAGANPLRLPRIEVRNSDSGSFSRFMQTVME